MRKAIAIGLSWIFQLAGSRLPAGTQLYRRSGSGRVRSQTEGGLGRGIERTSTDRSPPEPGRVWTQAGRC